MQIEYRESKAQTDLASLKELLYNKGAKLFKQVMWARNGEYLEMARDANSENTNF